MGLFGCTFALNPERCHERRLERDEQEHRQDLERAEAGLSTTPFLDAVNVFHDASSNAASSTLQAWASLFGFGGGGGSAPSLPLEVPRGIPDIPDVSAGGTTIPGELLLGGAIAAGITYFVLR